ncbi:efflux RND transporter periplasmic adaptor subunit [Falsiroseomonas sp. CW058]|uniref:efflux RND transporter periplasmic adaptor subunit n=1 Tax=Falsiroseomonas sp. CW058 TaxID=3388664 RepID=UPI003D30FBAA
MPRRPLLLLPLALLVATGWWATTPQAQGWIPAGWAPDRSWLPGWAGGATADGPRLRLAETDRGAVTAVVAATGTVNPVVSVQVGSQLSGQIRELNADFNSRVRAGEQMARLDTRTILARQAAAAADLQSATAAVLVARAQGEKAETDLVSARAQLLAARARVDAADAQARDAEAELRRAAELRARGVNAERDLSRAQFAAERLRAEAATARANVAQQEATILGAEAATRTAAAQVAAAEAAQAQRAAQLQQVEVDLANATIRAPIDGVVVSRNVDLGQTVAASLQAPILFMVAASLDEMEVWATVDESDIGRIRAGQEVTFTVAAHPGVNLRGAVKEIRLSPTTVQNVVTYTVVVSAANVGGRMLPGMTATMRIVTDQRRDAVRVPNAALRWRPPGAAAAESAAPATGGPVEQALRELPDLTPSQRQEIAAAQQELRDRMAALPQDAEARRQQQQAARQRLIARFNAVLTAEQRARLAELRAGAGSRGTAGTVHVVDEDGAAPRAVAVRTGLTDGTVTEVLSGLEEGMRVVVGTERGTAQRSAAAPPPGGIRPF